MRSPRLWLVILLAGLSCAGPLAAAESPETGPGWATWAHLGVLAFLGGVGLRLVWSKKRRAEARRARNQPCWENLETLPIPIAVFSRAGQPLVWNQAIAALTGIGIEKVRALRLPEIPCFGPENPITIEFAGFAGSDPRPGSRFETRIRCATDGREVPVAASLHLLQPGCATEPIVCLTLMDMTAVEAVHHESRQALSDAQSNMRRLSELERLKSEFLAICSHELRTPLVSITGYLDLLSTGKLGPLSPRQENALEVSLRNAGRLKELLDSLLDLARMEAGKMPFEFTTHRLGPMLEEAVAVMHPLAGQKELTLTVDSPPDLPTVWIDPSKLNRVFLNLLENAIKFTPKGGRIGIRASLESDLVQVEIFDTGIGIPPAEIDRVKEPFFQSDASDTRRAGGLGLGLAIAEKILLGHGTRLDLRSIQGQGTTVRFALKVARASPSGRRVAIGPGLAPPEP